jgi:peroxiredoxin Q/BCP
MRTLVLSLLLTACGGPAAEAPKAAPAAAPKAPAAAPAQAAGLTEGAKAPEITLALHDGTSVALSSLRGKSVLVYFYPKDDTPGCTREACAFRDGLEAFEERGATVFGISADDVASHARFRDKYSLNHPLLSDPTHAVCEAFGVWGLQRWRDQTYEGIARTTYVLRDGVVTVVFPDVDPTGHPERVLAVL